MTDVSLISQQKPERGEDQTAEVFLSLGQQILITVLAGGAVLYGILAGPVALLRFFAAAITLFYVVFVGFKLLVATAGAGYRFPRLTLAQDDKNLPTYSILVPMRDETRDGFRRLLEWIDRIDYPKDLLQVLFVVDEDDQSTLNIVRGHTLPAGMELVVVPDVGPRTKPKACNYAMTKVTGERTLIWDFEDRAEVLQLRKAVATLDFYMARDKTVACVQGMLQFWNPRDGLPSVLYWAEYVVHFRWMLTGLARLGLIPPLGGTSNHFLTSALWEVDRQYGATKYQFGSRIITVSNIWDSWNVTEDADLAARLVRCGFTIKMVDTVTFEGAPDTLRKAKNQKSRWLKGFIMTFLVQSRRPIRSMREMGVGHYLAYNLFIGGTPLSFLINPIMWATTALYLASRIFGWEGVTLFIEQLFPPYVYYPAMFVAVVGNFALLYQMLLTPLRQQEHESFQHVPVNAQNQQFGLGWRLFVGVALWWIFTTIPAYKGALELLRTSTRYYWNKTPHDLSGRHEDHILDGGGRQALPAGANSTSSWSGTGEHRRVR